MDKLVVLKDVTTYLSFITSFLDEYRAEFEYENEHCVINFLSEVKSSFEKDLIPCPLADKVSQSVYDLNIKYLIDTYEEQGRIHQWEIYKGICDRIITSGFL